MDEFFERTELVFGKENVEKIKKAHIAVFGVGGVGSFVCEALARCGVGKLDLIDFDTVSKSNINRQLIALNSTVGKYKADVMKERIHDINENAEVNVYKTRFSPETSSQFDFSEYDYVVDAIDYVTGKIELVMCCEKAGVPIISSMGAGNKVHPEMFELADIYNTSVCPLAKIMITELRKRNVKKLKVVYSKEPPIKNKSGIRMTGSNAFTPSAAGLIIAGAVIRDITGVK